MKKVRNIFIWVLIAAAVVAAILFFVPRDQSVQFRRETARISDVETFFTFTGNVESTGSQVYVAGTSSKIREWLVEEGDDVTKDTAIVRYENGTVVKSPMEGTISDLYIEEGDAFKPGTTLFRVADYANPVINFRVDEYDVHALRKGMKVEVLVLATGQRLEAEITRVAQEATVAGNLAYYPVRLSLPQDGSLPMGVSCEIIVPREQAEDVVVVPVEAIQYDDNGKPFIYTYDRYDEIIEQNVVLGVNDGNIVEVKEGLRQGETVLIPPSFGFDPMAMRDQMMEGWR